MNFDQTCRLIASSVSRRDVFKAIIASLAAAAVPWSAEAAKQGVVVKSKYIRVVHKVERQCNFQLFKRVQNVHCPPNTVKEIDSHTGPEPNPNPLCQRNASSRKVEYIGEVTVRCIKGDVSPS